MRLHLAPRLSRSRLPTLRIYQSLVFSGIAQPDAVWSLRNLHVMTGVGMTPTATVTLRQRNGQEASAAAMGTVSCRLNGDVCRKFYTSVP